METIVYDESREQKIRIFEEYQRGNFRVVCPKCVEEDWSF